MNNVDAVKLIVQTYKFDTPVPQDVRENMLRAKKNILIAIFKKYGRYSLFLMLTISIVLWLKKLGFGMSIAKAWVTVTVITTATAAAGTAGTIAAVNYAVNYIAKDKAAETQLKDSVADEKIVQQDETVKSDLPADANLKVPAVIKYKSVLMPFTAGGSTAGLKSRLEKEIFSRMRSVGGVGIVCTSGTAGVMTTYVITGSVFKMGSEIIINIKLINSGNSEVLLIINKKAKDEDEALNMASDIAAQLASKL